MHSKIKFALLASPDPGLKIAGDPALFSPLFSESSWLEMGGWAWLCPAAHGFPVPGGTAADHTFLCSTDTPAPLGRRGGRGDTR